MTIAVLHVISGLNQGGAEAMLARLLPVLEQTIFRQSVVSLTTRGVYGDAIEAAGIPLASLGMTGVASMPRSVRALRASIERQRPAVVQTWLYHADLLGLAAARLAGETRVVWNIRCASLQPGDVPASTAWIIRLLARLSSRPEAVVFNSHAGERAHRAIGYRPRRAIVIPNGFDLEARQPHVGLRRDFRREIGVDEDVFVVGMIARAHRMKDQSTFLAAAARLRDAGHRVRFVLAGLDEDWNNAALVRGIDRADLRDRVHLLGMRGDVPRIMNGLDCVVSTSTSEGFPNVLGEAMAAGVPCVATDAGDSAVIIGETGTVVPVGDAAGIAAGVARIIGMTPQERAALSERCRRRIAEHFELHAVAARYASLYEELAGARPATVH